MDKKYKPKKTRLTNIMESELVKKQLAINEMLANWNRRSDEKNWDLSTPSPSDPDCPGYAGRRRQSDESYGLKVA